PARQLYTVGPDLVVVSDTDLRPGEYLTRRGAVEQLDCLPSDQRKAVMLHHTVGLSLPEIANELSVPVDTVKSRIRLGLAKLRRGEPAWLCEEILKLRPALWTSVEFEGIEADRHGRGVPSWNAPIRRHVVVARRRCRFALAAHAAMTACEWRPP